MREWILGVGEEGIGSFGSFGRGGVIGNAVQSGEGRFFGFLKGSSWAGVRYGSGLVDLSNVDNVIVEEPEGENYQLIIPVFEINKKEEIVLLYTNNLDEKKSFKVVFDLEELDKDNKKEFTKSIKAGDSKEFKYKISLELAGKHLLKINIYSGEDLVQSIEKVVDVSPDIVIEDKLAGVSLR